MLDLDDIDLDEPVTDIGDQPTVITHGEAVTFPPPAIDSRGEMFFDLETVPDESRRPLFGLDEPIEQKPFTNPPVTGEAWVEWMKRPIAQIKEEVERYNPTDTWLEALDAWERKEKKPRQGVLDIVKGIRQSRNPGADVETDKIKRMSVTPEFCRIVAMGIGWSNVSIPNHAPCDIVNGFVVRDAIDERELLEWWWESVRSATSIIGYNIAGFDLPVIFARSAILGVKPTRRFDTRPWGTDLIDLMAVRWPKGSAMKLKDLARVMGIEVPAGDCDGSQVARLFKEDPAKLAQYVKSDVVICQQLKRKWTGFWC